MCNDVKPGVSRRASLFVDGKMVLILMRGDHTLVEQKLLDAVEAEEIRAADEAEIRKALGASPGSLGAGRSPHWQT